MTHPTATPRIYLDNAATSWPKPEAVYEAVDRYQRQLGAPAGRSVYAEAIELDGLVGRARHALARLIGASRPEQIAFALNGTDALNLAIQGIVRPGDHVVTSVAEHNSVLRPLRRLEDAAGVSVTRVGVNANGVVDPGEIAGAIQTGTRLVVLTAASNVTGALQPVAEVGRIARERGAFFLIDAAQAAGHIPLEVENLHADLLAAPGHKGLLGPLGTGVLYVRPGIEKELRAIRQGGTGSASEQDLQPDMLPDKYESGNLNAPGIVGLGAALGYIVTRGIDELRRHELDLTSRLLDGLRDASGVRVHGPADAASRVGVVSVSIQGLAPQEAAAILDSHYRIQVRSGLHCAPLMHKALGTLDGGGTLRLSLGPMTTAVEIDSTVKAIAEIASSIA